MRRIAGIAVWFISLAVPITALIAAEPAAGQVLPPADIVPVLRLNAGGPLSSISGLGFSADGRVLYAAGWDKLVHAWTLQGDRFVYNSQAALRIPVGAGLDGAINAMAISPDGEWIAVAGRGFAEGIAGQRQSGWILPSSSTSPATQLQVGMIYVFRPSTGELKLLRGHTGVVTSLCFAANRPVESPVLISTADDSPDGQTNKGTLRAWDVRAAREIGRVPQVPTLDNRDWTDWPDRRNWRPALAAWSTGPQPNQTWVAITWGLDRQLRLWNVATGRFAWAESGDVTPFLTRLPTPHDQLLAGSFHQTLTGSYGEIGIWRWSRPNGELPRLSRRSHFDQAGAMRLPPWHLPKAGVVFPSRTGGVADHVGLVIEERDPQAPGDLDRAEQHLLLLDAAGRFQQLADVRLWKGARVPSITASPDGQWLAVAGNDQHEIHVFKTRDLLAAPDRPRPHILHSHGEKFSFVAFARKDDDLALVLNPAPPEVSPHLTRPLRPGDRVFDFAGRILTEELAGWTMVAPPPGEWGLEHRIEDGRHVVAVLQNQRPTRTISLGSANEMTVTDFAICPPSKTCSVPLVAVAVVLPTGEPHLALYRADTGEEVRWLTGHVGAVRCLSFSPDGRMLASAGDDKVVSVWSLVDLEEETLGKHGMIPRLVLTDRGGELIVDEDPSHPIQPDDPFQLRDVFRGLEVNGREQTFRTALDFYREILARTPGERVRLLLRRRQQPLSVEVTVGQAVDERKPLFSLYFAPGRRPEQWSWIGWHPHGTFDSSDEAAERFLGWHFNTGDPSMPATFAVAAEYKDLFYRRNLLPQLLKAQELTDPPIPQPDVSLQLHQSGEALTPDYNDQVPIRGRDVRLTASLRSFPTRLVESLQWRLDNGEFHPLTRSSETTWEADLSNAPWSRRADLIHVKLVTRESPPREFLTQEFVRFQPPAPQLGTVELPGEVKSPQVPLHLEIPAPAEPAVVQLEVRNRLPEPIVRRWNVAGQALVLDEVLALQPGDNQITLTIQNAAALPDFEELERTRVVKTIRYVVPQLPTVAVRSVQVVPATGEPIPLELSEGVYQTRTPTIRIAGQLTWGGALKSATLRWDGSDQIQSLKNLPSDPVSPFAFEEIVQPPPGSHTLLVRAETADGVDEKRLTFRYLPELPEITALDATPQIDRELPAAFAADPLLYEGYHARQVNLRATLRPRGPEAYQYAVLVNNRPIPADAVQIDRNDPNRHELSATVELLPGPNQISVRLSNEWGTPAESREVRFEYRRPPQLGAIKAPTETEENRLDLSCDVYSPADLPLTDVSILVRNAPLPREQIAVRQSAADPQKWTVTVRDLKLSTGASEIRMTAANRDGQALEPSVHTIRVTVPTPAAPVVTLLGDGKTKGEMTVSSHQVAVRFRVTPIVSREDVRFFVGRTELNKEEVTEFEATTKDGVMTVSAKLNLEPDFAKANQCLVKITASNSNGSGTASLSLTYVEPPTTIKNLQLAGQRPERRAGGILFGEVETSPQYLEGEVHLRGTDVWPTKRQAFLKVWVNGFLRQSIELSSTEAQPTVAKFRVPVSFNRRTHNQVTLSTVGLSLEESSDRSFTVDCRRPEEDQQLYVVVIGMVPPEGETADEKQQWREATAKRLIQNAVEALGARQEGEFYRSAAFDRIRVEEPLINPHLFRVNGIFSKLREEFRRQPRVGGRIPNRVLMVYYQGRELVTQDGKFYLQTTDNPAPAASSHSLNGEYLKRNLADIYGAHLILLDVQQEVAGGRQADPLEHPHLGVIRRVWVGDQPAPEKAQLLSTLKEVIPDSSLLRDLKERMEDVFPQIKEQFPSLLADEPHIPPTLEELRVGTKAGLVER